MTIAQLIHTCDIYKKSSATDDGYGSVETWTKDQSDVKCRFLLQSIQKTYPMPKGVVVEPLVKALLAATATITPNSHRLVTSASGYEGTYDVTDVAYRGLPTQHYALTLQEVS
jgi:hypothetical protein